MIMDLISPSLSNAHKFQRCFSSYFTSPSFIGKESWKTNGRSSLLSCNDLVVCTKNTILVSLCMERTLHSWLQLVAAVLADLQSCH